MPISYSFLSQPLLHEGKFGQISCGWKAPVIEKEIKAKV